ncbi:MULTISPECIES: hypothetical protein [unclassified Arthrobacter]|uniref:hypothetical protein n=1 Tax=unclassified Arthrobacter TaxID=235627 RepID=UPI0011B05D2D|nr:MULTISPECIES: hypothetical protein [unclassified Arthrobacter]
MYDRSRDISKYTSLGYHEFHDVGSLLSQPLQTGLTSLKLEDQWFDFLFEDRHSATTLVTFTAAVPAKAETFPIFSSRHIAEELGLNFLAFADPSCGGPHALPTFWHLGTQKIDSQTLIPSIVSMARSETNSSLLFFGSSAGGFAALNYSSHFPNSAALVMNPRISLLNTPKRTQSYTPVNFPDMETISVIRSLPYDQSKVYSVPRGNRVFYIQNLQDSNYTRHHYAHFKKNTLGREDIEFVVGNWGKGHVVPPKSVYVDRLRNLARSAPNWTINPSIESSGEEIHSFDSQKRTGNKTDDFMKILELKLRELENNSTDEEFENILTTIKSSIHASQSQHKSN